MSDGVKVSDGVSVGVRVRDGVSLGVGVSDGVAEGSGEGVWVSVGVMIFAGGTTATSTSGGFARVGESSLLGSDQDGVTMNRKTDAAIIR